MKATLQYNDPFYTGRMNTRDYPLHEIGIIDGFYTYIASDILYVGNTQPNYADPLLTDDGNGYALVEYEGKVLRIDLSVGESPTVIRNLADLSTALGGLGANDYGIVNVYLGVHWEDAANSTVKLFTDDGSKGWVNATSLVSTGGTPKEPTVAEITTFLGTNFTVIDDIRKPLKVTLTSGTSVQKDTIVEMMRTISQAKLRCSSPAVYVSDSGDEYTVIVIGQIYVRGVFGGAGKIKDTANDTTLGVDEKSYTLATTTNAYLLHNDINYGGYKKALVDLAEAIMDMQIDGLRYGSAQPKKESVDFDNLKKSGDGFYWHVAKGTDILPIENSRLAVNLDTITESNGLTANAHPVKRFMIPVRMLYDGTTAKPKYNSLNVEFTLQRVNKVGISDGERWMTFGVQTYHWYDNLTAYGALLSRSLGMSGTDPYAYNAPMTGYSPTVTSLYKTKNLVSFSSIAMPTNRKNQLSGGWNCALLNSTDITKFTKSTPAILKDSLDTTNHISTTTSAGLEAYGLDQYVSVILLIQPSHAYISGEWILDRLNVFLSSDDITWGSGNGWGLRIANKTT